MPLEPVTRPYPPQSRSTSTISSSNFSENNPGSLNEIVLWCFYDVASWWNNIKFIQFTTLAFAFLSVSHLIEIRNRLLLIEFFLNPVFDIFAYRFPTHLSAEQTKGRWGSLFVVTLITNISSSIDSNHFCVYKSNFGWFQVDFHIQMFSKYFATKSFRSQSQKSRPFGSKIFGVLNDLSFPFHYFSNKK
jgi:hypothetical protein